MEYISWDVVISLMLSKKITIPDPFPRSAAHRIINIINDLNLFFPFRDSPFSVIDITDEQPGHLAAARFFFIMERVSFLFILARFLTSQIIRAIHAAIPIKIKT